MKTFILSACLCLSAILSIGGQASGMYAGGTNLYAYVKNNPTSATDPEGTCPAFCDDPDRIKQLEDKAIKSARGAKCHVKIKCQENCAHPAGDTSPPTAIPGSPGQYNIEVCVSTQWDAASQDLIIEHEMVHVQQFCTSGRGMRDTKECVAKETEAYKKSCGDAFPGDAAAQKKCRDCGVAMSCGTKEPPGGCTAADVGLSKK